MKGRSRRRWASMLQPESAAATTTTKSLISNKLEYAKNKTQSKNIRSKILNIFIIMNMMK
jgi:hypothetical protein